MRWLERKEIRGCEGRGDADSVYLVRYCLLETGPLRVYLHVFHRSDADDLHDHPWPFVSVLLWRGYVEQSECAPGQFADAVRRGTARYHGNLQHSRLRRFWPGSVLYRPASWTHRVQLVTDRNGKPKKAVSLVFVGPKQKSWGFCTREGFLNWREYFAKLRCF